MHTLTPIPAILSDNLQINVSLVFLLSPDVLLEDGELYSRTFIERGGIKIKGGKMNILETREGFMDWGQKTSKVTKYRRIGKWKRKADKRNCELKDHYKKIF